MHKGIWVVGSYYGEQAKKVLGLANEGVGYYVIENNKGGNLVVAFRYVGELPLPEYLIEIVDPMKIAAFEKKQLQRMGIADRGIKPASEATVKKVREIFEQTNLDDR